jgi:hypothetical protein
LKAVWRIRRAESGQRGSLHQRSWSFRHRISPEHDGGIAFGGSILRFKAEVDFFVRRCRRSAAPSSNALLVEAPPQFIALCVANGVSPQAALRAMAVMVCDLQYDTQNRLVSLDGAAA